MASLRESGSIFLAWGNRVGVKLAAMLSRGLKMA
jgi:hypothetical protein